MRARDALECNSNRKCREDEEEAFNLARTQLHEALASERNARRTVAQARAIMHEIKSSRGGHHPQGASKKG